MASGESVPAVARRRTGLGDAELAEALDPAPMTEPGVRAGGGGGRLNPLAPRKASTPGALAAGRLSIAVQNCAAQRADACYRLHVAKVGGKEQFENPSRIRVQKALRFMSSVSPLREA